MIEERVLNLFHKRPLIETETGCLEWAGYRNNHRGGYGQISTVDSKPSRKKRCHLAHRISFEIANGPIPPNMAVCHRCDNPPCCNPAHLFLGTKLENWNDMRAKKRNPIGSKHPHAKLNEEKVLIIRGMLKAGMSCRQVGKAFGISETAISGIKRRKGWKHVA